MTTIEWTDRTWNPCRGCSLVSAGCTNCYAMRMAHRFSGKGKPYHGLTKRGPKGPVWNGKVRLVPELLDQPLRWRKPSRVFVNSMSDLFHEALPDEAIDRVFAVMARAPQHTFQVLTKRPERMFEYLSNTDREQFVSEWVYDPTGRDDETRADDIPGLDTWPLPNVWLGVSVEDQHSAAMRVPWLLRTPAAVRFVSQEPQLGPIDWSCIEDMPFTLQCRASGVNRHRMIDPLYRTVVLHDVNGAQIRGTADVGVDWIIVGGESGRGARPFDLCWALSTVEQCKAANVPVFVKQIGARPVGGLSHWIRPDVPISRKGSNIFEWPKELRVREFPRAANDGGR